MQCQFIYINPRPTEQSLVELYSDHAVNPYFEDDYEPFEYERAVLFKIMREIQRYIPTGEFLEVGCGRGDFLRIAHMHGFSVTGCDISASKENIAPGVAFYQGTLKEAALPKASFDIVVIRNILEHLFDPNQEIREIWRVLKPGGYVYVKLPNGAFEHGLRCRLFFGQKQRFHPPYHLNHFDATSLRRLLANAHFEFVSWYLEQPTWRANWKVNVKKQLGYRAIQIPYLLSGRKLFPKPLLTCIAKKKAS